MKKFLFILLSFSHILGAENPWGKDSDLFYKPSPPQPVKACSTPIFGMIAELGIGLHKNVITHADGPRSHFFPNSSQYTLDAMRKYGFFIGLTKGCDRLMRENNEPWIYPKIKAESGQITKWDPVK